MLRNPLAWLRRNPSRASQDSQPALSLEKLEDRNLLAVYNIANIVDDPIAGGVDTLREAIIASNASVDAADTINVGPGTFTLHGDCTLTHLPRMISRR